MLLLYVFACECIKTPYVLVDPHTMWFGLRHRYPSRIRSRDSETENVEQNVSVRRTINVHLRSASNDDCRKAFIHFVQIYCELYLVRFVISVKETFPQNWLKKETKRQNLIENQVQLI